ncbi:MAG: putative transcriptional regulator [Firmicutes bacterium]|nr:putative transcriptional regulator [Bacillota bacterium]
MAGVSSRTLRYYDEIGILKPARINSSGYRMYGKREVDMLQQILFYREMGLSLDEIRAIVTEPGFNMAEALSQHRRKLLEKREQLDVLIYNVDKTIASMKGEISMADKEKFEGFKKKMIDENEEKYGKEVRESFGEDAINKSNAKLMGMSEEKYAETSRLAEEIMATLKEAIKTGDPAGELAQKAAGLHKKWLMAYWDSYSEDAHAGLAQMYVADERFKAYYDKEQPGTAEFLRDAVMVFTGKA